MESNPPTTNQRTKMNAVNKKTQIISTVNEKYRDRTATGFSKKLNDFRGSYPICIYINTDDEFEYGYNDSSQISPAQHANMKHLIRIVRYSGDIPNVMDLRKYRKNLNENDN